MPTIPPDIAIYISPWFLLFRIYKYIFFCIGIRIIYLSECGLCEDSDYNKNLSTSR